MARQRLALAASLASVAMASAIWQLVPVGLLVLAAVLVALAQQTLP